jgi:hypothetical protein
MFDPRERWLGCALAACLALPAGAEPAEPLAKGAKLCLHPLSLPLSESEAEARRPELERKLVDALAAASFEVAESPAVEALEQRVREETGGFVDPALGVRDPVRYRRYNERLAAALGEELDCDAQIFASVVTLRAWFSGGVARWDGASRKVSSTGRLVANAIWGVEESGWVSAFSLWLLVTDLEGQDLAFRSAGIETPVQLAFVEDKDLVPEDRWLTDAVSLDEAIFSALGSGGVSLRRHGRP